MWGHSCRVNSSGVLFEVFISVFCDVLYYDVRDGKALSHYSLNWWSYFCILLILSDSL